MPRGGNRNGAGRTIGAKGKLRQRIEEAEKSGELPHMFLLRVSRGEYITHGNREVLPDFKMRLRAAEMAASFFAPKLALVQQTVKQEVNHVISGEVLTEDQFESKYIDSMGTTT